MSRTMRAFLVLICFLLLASCAPAPGRGTPQPTLGDPTPYGPKQAAPTPSPGAIELTVLHTNDVDGEVEPCG